MTEHEQSTDQQNVSSIEIIPKNIILYWMSGQIASWKLRIALEEKQLQGYKSIMIIRPDQFDKTDDFWKNNEYGMVPSLRIQDITLNCVLPALLFLETFMPIPMPESSMEEKALVFERAFESLHFQRASSQDLITSFLSLDNYDVPFIDTDAREKILISELIRWNDYLTQQYPMHGIAHTSFTLADILFFPELALAVRHGLSLDYFPCLDNYYKTLSKRPSIRKTWPYHWLHTTLKYNCLSNVNRFAIFYQKQPERICQNTRTFTSNTSIPLIELTSNDEDEKIEVLTQSSEEIGNVND